jgi:hypothetical protein
MHERPSNFGSYNTALYDLIKVVDLPKGYKINFKNNHTFRDGFVFDAKVIKSQILSLTYNGVEIGLMNPRFQKTRWTNDFFVSVGFIQGIQSTLGKPPKEWFSNLLSPLISSVNVIDSKLPLIYVDSQVSNVTFLLEKIGLEKSHGKQIQFKIDNCIVEKQKLEALKSKSSSVKNIILEFKINDLNRTLKHLSVDLNVIKEKVSMLKGKLTFITTVRDRFFDKNGILDLVKSKKSRVLKAIAVSKKVLIPKIKARKQNFKVAKISKVPKVKNQNVKLFKSIRPR